jgi:hypothetical protein
VRTVFHACRSLLLLDHRLSAIKTTNDHPFKHTLSIKLIDGGQTSRFVKLPIRRAIGGGNVVDWNDVNLCVFAYNSDPSSTCISLTSNLQLSSPFVLQSEYDIEGAPALCIFLEEIIQIQHHMQHFHFF